MKMYAHKRGNISNTFKSVEAVIKVDAFRDTIIAKRQRIKYKKVLCEVIRIDKVEIINGEVMIHCKLTPLEAGLN